MCSRDVEAIFERLREEGGKLRSTRIDVSQKVFLSLALETHPCPARLGILVGEISNAWQELQPQKILSRLTFSANASTQTFGQKQTSTLPSIRVQNHAETYCSSEFAQSIPP